MYGKLFVQMFDGTLATKGPWQAMVTFQQFVILADREGIVDMTPESISRRTTIPLDVIRIGIEALLQPDSESRSDAEEGRRIVPLSASRSWGWKIVNHSHYRKMRSEDDRRDYHREYARQRRAKDQQSDVDVNNCQHVNPASTESTNSSKQYAVSSKQLNTSSNLGSSSPRRTRRRGVEPFISQQQADSFEQFWSEYWRRVGKEAAKKAYAKKITTTGLHALVMSAIAAQADMMNAREMDKIPHAATWLNGERWTDEILPASDSRPKSKIELLMEQA